ncbi:hypothetical protein C8P63_11270 [Melghirimyces profundicolus]|uniref:Uncharacterized protein n=1 Tax=Melghirimyces profundicolus TaxID=1242148 RepID=A0A2T6BTG1_9BACL|nr:hypothetical protein [Melghirimyces profundicolus]PTX59375.1 hypothetical protein C8P63_11270 [Melghirimyces profundicolus]
MSETYSLRRLRGTFKERSFDIPIEEAWIKLEMPGPYNLKSWSVGLKGVDASAAGLLDDCYYYGNGRLILEMETLGEKKLRGEAVIRSLAVGPRSRVEFSGSGFLKGFESL